MGFKGTVQLESHLGDFCLTGDEINQRIGTDIQIDPFDERNLNPNSYNLSLHNEIMTYEEVVLDMRKCNRIKRLTIPRNGLTLQPNKLYLGRTIERGTATQTF